MRSAAQMPIRVFPCALLPEVARAHFVKNMFVAQRTKGLVGFKPDFIVMNGAKVHQPAVEKSRAELGKLRGVQPD